jgi:acetolactate synthase I/II/III large subunit
MLVAGSRMGNLDTPFDKYWGDPASQRVIQIDVDPRSLGVSRSLTLGIVSDVRDALEGLFDRLRGMDVASRDTDDLARYRALDEHVRLDAAKPILEWQGPGIHPAHAIGAVGTVFGEDAVYTIDGGNTSLWAASVLPPTRPRSYHNIFELGMLGTGIPSAIGAKLGAPDREVVCVVMAEGAWTMEETNELAQYGKTFGTRQGEIRWDIVAQGLGCHAEYVERIEDLDAALRRAQAHDGPSLVCVRSDRDANFAVPEGMVSRFFEVYFGPAEEGVEVEARI